MIYQSDSLSVQRLEGGIAELNFDRQGESVNKFDQQTVASLRAALDLSLIHISEPTRPY